MGRKQYWGMCNSRPSASLSRFLAVRKCSSTRRALFMTSWKCSLFWQCRRKVLESNLRVSVQGLESRAHLTRPENLPWIAAVKFQEVQIRHFQDLAASEIPAWDRSRRSPPLLPEEGSRSAKQRGSERPQIHDTSQRRRGPSSRCSGRLAAVSRQTSLPCA